MGTAAGEPCGSMMLMREFAGSCLIDPYKQKIELSGIRLYSPVKKPV